MSNISIPSRQFKPARAETILRHVGVILPHYRVGVTRIPCPVCSPHRKQNHRHLKCLTVEIRADDSCIWCCHHPGCDFAGPRPEHVRGLRNGQESRPMLEHRAASREGNSRGTGRDGGHPPCSSAGHPADWVPMVPPPPSAAKFVPPRGTTAVYTYYDEQNRLLFYVSRRDYRGGKDILPWTYGILNGNEGWHCKRMNPPLPLFGLRLLPLLPDGFTVFVVEGEKAMRALNYKLGCEEFDACAVTWPGGADNIEYVDWSPLWRHNVILWPDADEQGLRAMNAIERLLPRVVARVYISGLPSGFDAADLPDTDTALEQFLKERCR